jgi:uncharacterized protein YjiS (DUF1127 family)
VTAWRIEKATVYRLYRDEQPIRTADGQITTYETEEQAQHVAANWELYRCPTVKELREMSDDELLRRASAH